MTHAGDGATPSSEARAGDRQPLVLLIDDDIDICFTVQDLLESEGYPTATAANGKLGLELLERIRPRLILLDLTMPVMDGVRFRELQLRDAKLADIPTVVMTAHGRAAQIVAPLRVNECLEKPVQLERLLQVVDHYCKR
jgi:CheY-like chemotaxis protein